MRLFLITLLAAALTTAYHILDPSNFDSSIADGHWFVKYYSATCPWSRRFAPTWERVYTDLEDTLASRDIFFGEVECKAHRPLCDAATIDGYPTVVYYRDGENMGEVPGGQSFESLSGYIQNVN